ncbi:pilin [Kroppenstedtia eburnea]|uniref:pilin n=1 Tax=Kroppenstedtia eburnea TaxID=714067 RepID=UPI0036437DF4
MGFSSIYASIYLAKENKVPDSAKDLDAVKGFTELLEAVSDILVYLLLPALGVVIAIGAFQYLQADDGMEKAAVKKKFRNIAIGTAIGCTAPSIANWVWGFFQ